MTFLIGGFRLTNFGDFRLTVFGQFNPTLTQRDKWNIEKEQNTNHTQVSLTCISKTNLIFFYGGCKVMHHADFLQVRKGTGASF